MKKNILFICFFVLSTLGFTQSSINVYPFSCTYSSGTFTNTTIVDGTIEIQGHPGFIKFDLSSFSTQEIIYKAVLHYSIQITDLMDNNTANCILRDLILDPFTASHSDLEADCNDGTILGSGYIVQSGFGTIEFNNDGINFIQNRINSGWLGIGLSQTGWGIWINGYNSTSKPYIELFYGTNVVNEMGNNSISLFPNPATNELFVKNNEINSVITIFDINGKLLITRKITSENEVIDINNLQSGIYTIKIADNRGIITRKFAKQ